jgi:SET domain-containing protein
MSSPALSIAPPTGIVVGPSPGRGRGVFASRPFAPGECIERAPVLVLPRAELEPLRRTLLDSYWFWWDEAHNACALGYASLYNHQCPANARFAPDAARAEIVFTAARAIAAGEEITINYLGEPDDPTPPWFPVV